MDITGETGISAIGQIAVPIKDQERAVRFYRDTLGLRFLFQVPNLAFFNCGGVRLLLDRGEPGTTRHQSSILYFLVADIQTATGTLRARGAEITDEPHVIARMADHDLWMSFFLDSEGNTMALMAEVREGLDGNR
jgi:methylmalonyl-CoA/ethylmalonyl-CoA epimerase